MNTLSVGLDLMPTLCDYAGIAVPAGLTGHSLRRSPKVAKPKSGDQVVAECGGGGVKGVNVPGRMVRTKQFKYTAYSSSYRPPHPRTKKQSKAAGNAHERRNAAAGNAQPLLPQNLGKEPLEELFDLQKDPGERNNLAGKAEFKDVLGEHRQRLARWCKETGDSSWAG